MATYLLTWNPKKWPWVDFHDRVAELHARGSFQEPWGCGSSKRIRKGDRVFLLRQGMEPRGVIASGVAISGVYQDEHWRADARARGALANWVSVEWDELLDPFRDRIIPRSDLDAPRFRDVNWNTQQSGIVIPDPVAELLEEEWRRVVEINHARDEERSGSR